MAEQNMTMNKRKRVYCASLQRHSKLLSTRNKSQIFRSTQTLTNSNWPESQFHLKKPKTASKPSDSISATAKDLRTHRVFSNPLLNDSDIKLGAEIGGSNPDLNVGHADAKLTAEFVQSTPPDAEILGGDLQFNVSVNTNQEIGDDTICRSKAKVLNQSFRGKLLKTPSSFSYRRLLPYLEQISKGNSGNSASGEVQNEEKVIEKKPLESILVSEIASISLAQNEDSCNDLNLSSIKRAPESPVLDDSNGVSLLITSPHAPMVLGCSSELAANLGTEVFETPDPWLDQNTEKLDSCSSSLEKGNQFTKGSSGSTEMNDGGSENTGEDDGVDQCSDDKLQSETMEEIFFDAEGPSTFQDQSCMDSRFSDPERLKLCGTTPLTGNDHGDLLNQTDALKNEYVAKTTLNADMSSKPQEDRFGHVKVEFPSPDQALEKKLAGSIRDNSCVDNKISDFSPESKPVLNRCSRVRLFRAPGSYSYKRLLPFLKDIARDDQCAPGNGYVSKSYSLEKTAPPLVASGVCNEKAVGDSSPATESYNFDRCARPDGISGAAQGLSEMQVQQNAEAGGKLETAPDTLDSFPGSESSTMSMDSFATWGSFPKQDASLVLHQLAEDSQKNHMKSMMKYTNDAKPVDADGMLQGPSRVETSIHLGITASGCNKGILKRIPRGCRGPCTCLNCSSFHLHAERAFEFSRNQMQDAEEVALDLIKTVSYLRNILEKSTSGSDDSTSIIINQVNAARTDDVKDACRKASEAEELAKNRILQMHYDLDIHCRIPAEQRSTVRFANSVREKVIPETEFPN